MVVYGFPLWWAMGAADMMPIVMAVPMALRISRRRPLRTPPGFAAWAVFLLCVIASATLIFVDAPGAVPGEAGARPVVVTYRLLQYLSITVVLLWVGNLSESELPKLKVMRILGWMFVVTVAGGLLGVVAPSLELRSPLEILLPEGLASSGFLKPLIHPATASIQAILGEDSPRPIAPFAYSNTWGAAFSMCLPFFFAGWLGRDAGWRRPAGLLVLFLSAIPLVYSLNRGLWISLALGLLFVLLRLAFAGRPGFLLAALVAILLGGVIFFSSPLAGMVSERLDNPHSNDRRQELIELTVRSTATGSPLLGFGSTRDVQGSFASIAGGGTPECPACEVPPLGTQGQLWLVVFSQGLLGAAAFVAFYSRQVVGHWRARSTVELVGVLSLLFLAVQVLVYDTLGVPMYVVMIAIGLMWRRERSGPASSRSGSSLQEMGGQLRRNARLLLTTTVVGAVAGTLFAMTRPVEWVATVPIALAPAPVHLDLSGERTPRGITVDTEASMVFSERAIQLTRDRLDEPLPADLRSMIRVTAPSNTRVIQIEVTEADADQAARIAEALSESYLEVRSEYLSLRKAQVLADLRRQLEVVAGTGVIAAEDPDAEEEDAPLSPQLAEDRLREEINALLVMPTSAGDILRDPELSEAPRHIELPFVSGMVAGFVMGLLIVWFRGRRFPTGRLEVPSFRTR